MIQALLGTWPIIRAHRLRVLDATERVRLLLGASDLLERCLGPDTWQKIGVTLVEVEPDGDILPARAAYDPEGLDFGIGVNPLHYEGRLWYALPDLVAASLLNPGKMPRVLRALRLAPRGKQTGLRSVRLRGGLELDPNADRDPFLTMIEQRQRVRDDPDLSEEERERLQLFLKITANGTSYGSLARFDRRERSEPEDLLVHGPDSEPRPWKLATPEDPGPYCFPPVAASITAGARLMLALLERLVTDAGGTYAFMDTDSMAIVAAERGRRISYSDGKVERSVQVLDHDSVGSILARFKALNPYDPELLEPWKVEYESLDRPLWCYAISSKRYCLYRLGSEGKVEIVSAEDLDGGGREEQLADWSEHGLGAYMDPSGRALRISAMRRAGGSGSAKPGNGSSAMRWATRCGCLLGQSARRSPASRSPVHGWPAGFSMPRCGRAASACSPMPTAPSMARTEAISRRRRCRCQLHRMSRIPRSGRIWTGTIGTAAGRFGSCPSMGSATPRR